MPATGLISNSAVQKVDTVTVNGVVSSSGPDGERKVIDLTGIGDTVTYQDTGLPSFAGGITLNMVSTVATHKTIRDYWTADTSFTFSTIIGSGTASGPCKVTKMGAHKLQSQNRAEFDCTLTPLGNMTMGTN